MERVLRNSGVEQIGRLPWGTHLCQFYQSREDLLEILVPYFRAGLGANEYCMWVTSEPLTVRDATAALGESVADLHERIAAGQIDILPYDHWYLDHGSFEFRRVLAAWQERLDRALAAGYSGMRVTGNTAWLEQSRWDDFAEYEAAINGVVGRLPALVLCTYSTERCGASEVIDVVGSHEFAMIKRAGTWKAVENSERKRMAEALRESERRLRLLFEQMTSGCAYHQMVYEGERPVDYVYIEANPAFERQTGLRRETLIGRRATQVLPGIAQDDFDWIGTFGRVATTGEPVRFEQASGPLNRWYAVTAYSPAKGYFVTVFDDVTERRRVEEQREDLIRTVTHDLRTPLSVIAVAAQTLQRQPASTPSVVDAVLRSCSSMSTMLNDLSDMALLEAGRVPLQRLPVDLGLLLTQLVARLAGTLAPGRIRLTLAPGLPPVEGVADRLERVFVNLVTNALKYSPAEREVRVDACHDEAHVTIAVADDGPGIRAADLPHLFDRFFRTSEARAHEGLGLGLYIARMLVEAHGGTIRVESEPGRGSRFQVRLPRSA